MNNIGYVLMDRWRKKKLFILTCETCLLTLFKPLSQLRPHELITGSGGLNGNVPKTP